MVWLFGYLGIFCLLCCNAIKSKPIKWLDLEIYHSGRAGQNPSEDTPETSSTELDKTKPPLFSNILQPP